MNGLQHKIEFPPHVQPDLTKIDWDNYPDRRQEDSPDREEEIRSADKAALAKARQEIFLVSESAEENDNAAEYQRYKNIAHDKWKSKEKKKPSKELTEEQKQLKKVAETNNQTHRKNLFKYLAR